MLEQHKKNKRVNDFLEYWAKIAKENPQIDFNSKSIQNAIYNELIFLGVKKEDKKVNLRDNLSPTKFKSTNSLSEDINIDSAFNNWLTYYKDSNKLNAFVNPNWAYFCQFISKNRTAEKAQEHIKIYVPLDSNHIEGGAKMIFDFLSFNNISHLSKIGKNIRFDDIVIRLVNPEDADKLINYIKSNQYLQEGLINANPFAFQKDNIALACDGNQSYNSTVAGMIGMYIEERKKSNNLNKVNSYDFANFILSEYKKQFITKESNKLADKFEFTNSKEDYINYKEIFALMINAQNPNFKYKDFLNHYENCSGRKRSIQNNIIETNSLLLDAINEMINRFGDEQAGIKNVEAYIYSGNERLLTRNNNLRDRVTKSSLRETINKILTQRKIDFMTYCQEINNNYRLNKTKRSL